MHSTLRTVAATISIVSLMSCGGSSPTDAEDTVLKFSIAAEVPGLAGCYSVLHVSTKRDELDSTGRVFEYRYDEPNGYQILHDGLKVGHAQFSTPFAKTNDNKYTDFETYGASRAYLADNLRRDLNTYDQSSLISLVAQPRLMQGGPDTLDKNSYLAAVIEYGVNVEALRIIFAHDITSFLANKDNQAVLSEHGVSVSDSALGVEISGKDNDGLFTGLGALMESPPMAAFTAAQRSTVDNVTILSRTDCEDTSHADGAKSSGASDEALDKSDASARADSNAKNSGDASSGVRSRLSARMNWTPAPSDDECATGDRKSCDNVKLGIAFDKGSGVKRDQSKAREYFQQACDGDNAFGCAKLAWYLNRGYGGLRDLPGAVTASMRACDLGDVKSCSAAGRALFIGKDVPKDYEQSRFYRRRGCDGGAADDCESLAKMLINGWGGAKDEAAARPIFVLGCDGGDGEACSGAARMFLFGKGGDKDLAAARHFYDRGCELKPRSYSCIAYARLLYYGDGGTQDQDRAIAILQDDCDKPSDVACETLAELTAKPVVVVGAPAAPNKLTVFYSLGCADCIQSFKGNIADLRKHVRSGALQVTFVDVSMLMKAAGKSFAVHCVHDQRAPDYLDLLQSYLDVESAEALLARWQVDQARCDRQAHLRMQRKLRALYNDAGVQRVPHYILNDIHLGDDIDLDNQLAVTSSLDGNLRRRRAAPAPAAPERNDGVDAQNGSACEMVQIAGIYNSGYGALECAPDGPGLSCCYLYRGDACVQGIRLAFNADQSMLVGDWVYQDGSSGKVQFGVNRDCTLSNGKWGYGAPTTTWTVTGRVAEQAARDPRMANGENTFADR